MGPTTTRGCRCRAPIPIRISTTPSPHEHLRIVWSVDFAARTLAGHVTLRLHAPAQGALDLDTRELVIGGIDTAPPRHRTRQPDVATRPAEPGPMGEVLGRRLRVELAPDNRELTIRYHTTPAGHGACSGSHPNRPKSVATRSCFSQCQPIHARSLVPVQDSRARASRTTPR